MPREALWLAPQDRIKVLASLAALAGALALIIAFVAVFAAFTYPTDATAGATPIYVGTVDLFEVGKPVFYKPRDLYVVKREDGSIIALYAVDPRRPKCQLEWRPDIPDPTGRELPGVFYADCARTTFNAFGERIVGPSRAMDRFPVEVKGNSIYVRAVRQLLIRGGRE